MSFDEALHPRNPLDGEFKPKSGLPRVKAAPVRKASGSLPRAPRPAKPPFKSVGMNDALANIISNGTKARGGNQSMIKLAAKLRTPKKG